MSSMSETKDIGANYGENNRTNLGLRERLQFQGLHGEKRLPSQYYFILQLGNNRVIPW